MYTWVNLGKTLTKFGGLESARGWTWWGLVRIWKLGESMVLSWTIWSE